MNPKILSTIKQLSNNALVERVKNLAERERETTVSLVAHLAELDLRRLYLAEGYSSLFTYCTQALRLSESAAYRRIEAARAVRSFPIILDMLEQGLLNLTTVRLLAVHLTEQNHRDVLRAAQLKSKREVLELIARIHPQPPVPSTIRKLPNIGSFNGSPTAQRTDSGSQLEERRQRVANNDAPPLALASLPDHPHSAEIVPLAPERYKVQFTASADMYGKLRLAQNLLRHQIPDGDPAEIFDRALTALLEELAKKKLAATDRPRATGDHIPGSRHIPAEVRRAVWLRDGGRCTFVSRTGRRCTEEVFLEFHHVVPYATGGPPTIDNIHLRCRAHNAYEAELDFGPRMPSAVRESREHYLITDGAATQTRSECGTVCNSVWTEHGVPGLGVGSIDAVIGAGL